MMEYAIAILIVFALIAICPGLLANDTGKLLIQVFYKNKAPSLIALEKINETLENYRDVYDIRYNDIEDETNFELIKSYGLPSNHFPVAVVIGGKFTIIRDHRITSFVHFPDFMKGIGRHEGNWSITDLEAALKDNSLLLDTNQLPELEEDESDSKCE